MNNIDPIKFAQFVEDVRNPDSTIAGLFEIYTSLTTIAPWDMPPCGHKNDWEIINETEIRIVTSFLNQNRHRHMFADYRNRITDNQKIMAIKIIRSMFDINLRNAKMIVEADIERENASIKAFNELRNKLTNEPYPNEEPPF